MKYKVLLLLFSLPLVNLFAQDADTTKAWKFTDENKVTVANTSLSNWNAGGESALSMLFSLDYSLEYKKDKVKWSNRLNAIYGMNKQNSNPLTKTDDRLEFTSNIGYKMSEHWYYAFELNFLTQFDVGYETDSLDVTRLSSKFMAPGNLTLAPGFEYVPNDNFKLDISPIAGRFVFVLEDSLSLAGAYGVDPGKKVKYEFGLMINANWKHNFNDHFGMEHNLRMFSNYIKNPQNIDIYYNGKIFVKATKYISVDFIVDAIYDDDIKIDVDGSKKAALQLKSVLGAGLTVSF